MDNTSTKTNPSTNSKQILYIIIVFICVLAFVATFLLVDNVYYKFSNTWFPNVGTSAWLASLWGVVSRLHLIILMVPLVIWKPRLFGFQMGKTWQHWRMLLIMLIANCGVIAAYLWLTGSTTPYSGNQWLATEIIIVPMVEETFWRGLVFFILLKVLSRFYSDKNSTTLTILLSGLAFGLLHANNLFAGVPIQFITIQVLNASIWGIMYGYTRSRTESIYPSMFLHAAMNFVVVLF
jgi:membrane protease YdiL (CAAX protease family)